MSISCEQLIEQVIRPTLRYLNTWSLAAEKLLISTVENESGLSLNSQKSEGLGIYRITPDQHTAVWNHYLAKRPDLASKVRGLASQHHFLYKPDAELSTNLSYSTAIAWMIYQQAELPLPLAEDAKGLDSYWHKNFHPITKPNSERHTQY